MRHQLVIDTLHAAVMQGKVQDVLAWIDKRGTGLIDSVRVGVGGYGDKVWS